MAKALETPHHAGKTGRIPKPKVHKRGGGWWYYEPEKMESGVFRSVRAITLWLSIRGPHY